MWNQLSFHQTSPLFVFFNPSVFRHIPHAIQQTDPLRYTTLFILVRHHHLTSCMCVCSGSYTPNGCWTHHKFEKPFTQKARIATPHQYTQLKAARRVRRHQYTPTNLRCSAVCAASLLLYTLWGLSGDCSGGAEGLEAKWDSLLHSLAHPTEDRDRDPSAGGHSEVQPTVRWKMYDVYFGRFFTAAADGPKYAFTHTHTRARIRSGCATHRPAGPARSIWEEIYTEGKRIYLNEQRSTETPHAQGSTARNDSHLQTESCGEGRPLRYRFDCESRARDGEMAPIHAQTEERVRWEKKSISYVYHWEIALVLVRL